MNIVTEIKVIVLWKILEFQQKKLLLSNKTVINQWNKSLEADNKKKWVHKANKIKYNSPQIKLKLKSQPTPKNKWNKSN